jgi:hypothetical protein
MSGSIPDSAPLDRALRRAHRTTLLGLAACALVTILQPEATETAPPPTLHTMIALGLALGTILSRQLGTSPRLAPKARVLFTLAGFGLAAVLGVFGAGLALATGTRQTGLLFTLAAALFCLRPPPPAVPPCGHGDGAAC